MVPSAAQTKTLELAARATRGEPRATPPLHDTPAVACGCRRFIRPITPMVKPAVRALPALHEVGGLQDWWGCPAAASTPHHLSSVTRVRDEPVEMNTCLSGSRLVGLDEPRVDDGEAKHAPRRGPRRCGTRRAGQRWWNMNMTVAESGHDLSTPRSRGVELVGENGDEHADPTRVGSTAVATVTRAGGGRGRRGRGA